MDPNDELAAIELASQYAWFLDSGDLGRFTELFAADGVLVLSESQRCQGRQEILDAIQRIKQDFPAYSVQHFNSNFVFEREGDQCRMFNYWFAVVQPNEGDTPFIAAMGHYVTQLVKVGGSWKIACRTVRSGPIEQLAS